MHRDNTMSKRRISYVLTLTSLTSLICGCSNAPTMAHYKPVSHWVQSLQDPSPRVRKQAVTILGNVGPADPAAIPALTAAVKDSDVTVRREAILALLKLGRHAQHAVPALTEAQNDEDPRVRLYATKALERIRSR
jgi:HEAT repeat protein